MMDTNFAAPPRPVLPGPSHHRRALSDTLFDIDDVLLDDVVVSELNFEAPLTPPSLLPKNGPGRGLSQSSQAQPVKTHVRSLSVDAGLFDGLVFDTPAPISRPGSHVRSCSMDRYSSATSFEVENGNDSSNGVKKAMATDRLAELSLIDPKRAKRILANRQSAARSKERKIRYTGELEKKVQTLQTEATNLSAQITLLQKDATGLTSENKELKLKLQAMEQQAHLRDALNEALREELRWLKINGSNRVSPSQFGSQPATFNYFDNQIIAQTQQQTIHTNANPGLGGHNVQNFQDFNKTG